ncbi:MAG TPA: hypothetical protein VF148_11990 [Acidimicrobiia bacterium]
MSSLYTHGLPIRFALQTNWAAAPVKLAPIKPIESLSMPPLKVHVRPLAINSADEMLGGVTSIYPSFARSAVDSDDPRPGATDQSDLAPAIRGLDCC